MTASDIAQSFWLQFGALGLLSISGWAVAWHIWRAYQKQAVRATDALIESATAMTKLAGLIEASQKTRVP